MITVSLFNIHDHTLFQLFFLVMGTIKFQPLRNFQVYGTVTVLSLTSLGLMYFIAGSCVFWLSSPITKKGFLVSLPQWYRGPLMQWVNINASLTSFIFIFARGGHVDQEFLVLRSARGLPRQVRTVAMSPLRRATSPRGRASTCTTRTTSWTFPESLDWTP